MVSTEDSEVRAPVLILWTLVFFAGPMPLEVRADDVSVIVGPFDALDASDLGKRAGRLLGDLVASELSAFEDCKVVDREFLEASIEEQSRSGRSSRLGTFSGASSIVRGQVFSVEKKLIVTARITATETGDTEVAHVDANRGADLTTIAHRLAARIREVLLGQLTRRATSPSPAGKSGPPPAAQTTELGFLIHVDENIQGQATRTGVTASALAYGLMGAGGDVFESRTMSTVEWLEARQAGKNPPPPFDHPVDRIVIVEARSTAGRRTGKLITVEVRLETRVFSEDGEHEIDRFTVDASGVAPRVAVASGEALRNASARVVDRLVSGVPAATDE